MKGKQEMETEKSVGESRGRGDREHKKKGCNIMYPPFKFVLQRGDGHRTFQAAFYRHLERVLVLLKQEVPPLWCSSSNHKNSHSDVNREAENRGGIEFSNSSQKAWKNKSFSTLRIQLWLQTVICKEDFRTIICRRLLVCSLRTVTPDLMVPSESFHWLKSSVALATQGG